MYPEEKQVTNYMEILVMNIINQILNRDDPQPRHEKGMKNQACRGQFSYSSHMEFTYLKEEIQIDDEEFFQEKFQQVHITLQTPNLTKNIERCRLYKYGAITYFQSNYDFYLWTPNWIDNHQLPPEDLKKVLKQKKKIKIFSSLNFECNKIYYNGKLKSASELAYIFFQGIDKSLKSIHIDFQVSGSGCNKPISFAQQFYNSLMDLTKKQEKFPEIIAEGQRGILKYNDPEQIYPIQMSQIYNRLEDKDYKRFFSEVLWDQLQRVLFLDKEGQQCIIKNLIKKSQLQKLISQNSISSESVIKLLKFDQIKKIIVNPCFSKNSLKSQFIQTSGKLGLPKSKRTKNLILTDQYIEKIMKKTGNNQEQRQIYIYFKKLPREQILRIPQIIRNKLRGQQNLSKQYLYKNIRNMTKEQQKDYKLMKQSYSSLLRQNRDHINQLLMSKRFYQIRKQQVQLLIEQTKQTMKEIKKQQLKDLIYQDFEQQFEGLQQNQQKSNQLKRKLGSISSMSIKQIKQKKFQQFGSYKNMFIFNLVNNLNKIGKQGQKLHQENEESLNKLVDNIWFDDNIKQIRTQIDRIYMVCVELCSPNSRSIVRTCSELIYKYWRYLSFYLEKHVQLISLGTNQIFQQNIFRQTSSKYKGGVCAALCILQLYLFKSYGITEVQEILKIITLFVIGYRAMLKKNLDDDKFEEIISKLQQKMKIINIQLLQDLLKYLSTLYLSFKIQPTHLLIIKININLKQINYKNYLLKSDSQYFQIQFFPSQNTQKSHMICIKKIKKDKFYFYDPNYIQTRQVTFKQIYFYISTFNRSKGSLYLLQKVNNKQKCMQLIKTIFASIQCMQDIFQKTKDNKFFAQMYEESEFLKSETQSEPCFLLPQKFFKDIVTSQDILNRVEPEISKNILLMQGDDVCRRAAYYYLKRDPYSTKLYLHNIPNYDNYCYSWDQILQKFIYHKPQQQKKIRKSNYILQGMEDFMKIRNYLLWEAQIEANYKKWSKGILKAKDQKQRIYKYNQLVVKVLKQTIKTMSHLHINLRDICQILKNSLRPMIQNLLLISITSWLISLEE